LEPPYVDSIEWAKWHVFWVDERVVPKDHQDSNYKLAFDGFLSKVCCVNVMFSPTIQSFIFGSLCVTLINFTNGTLIEIYTLIII
jgi:hypothetical protein